MSVCNYTSLVGSRSYPINILTSDYDIISTTEENIPNIPHSHSNILIPEIFIYRLFLKENKFDKDYKYTISSKDPRNLQLLFPAEFFINNELIDYLQNTKNKICEINTAQIGISHYLYADIFSDKLNFFFERGFLKRPLYACLFYDTLYRYATKDIPFEEAFHPEEEFQQWLIALRKKELSFEEVEKRLLSLQKDAHSVKRFYTNKKLNKSLANEIIFNLNDLTGAKVTL